MKLVDELLSSNFLELWKPFKTLRVTNKMYFLRISRANYNAVTWHTRLYINKPSSNTAHSIIQKVVPYKMISKKSKNKCNNIFLLIKIIKIWSVLLCFILKVLVWSYISNCARASVLSTTFINLIILNQQTFAFKVL